MLTDNPAAPIANVTFAPGTLNSWHVHKGGQVLLVTHGRGWYCEWEGAARELKPGDVVDIPAGVKHWHGAAKDSWFAHISIEIDPEKGPAEWLEPCRKLPLKLNRQKRGDARVRLPVFSGFVEGVLPQPFVSGFAG